MHPSLTEKIAFLYRSIADLIICNFVLDDKVDSNSKAVTAFLRVMLLRASPSAAVMAKLSPNHNGRARLVEAPEGARLRARLPAYLAQRRALLGAHSPLIAPLQALVAGYEEPTTTDELWAMGLGVLPRNAKRPRLEVAVDRRPSATPLRPPAPAMRMISRHGWLLHGLLAVFPLF